MVPCTAHAFCTKAALFMMCSTAITPGAKTHAQVYRLCLSARRWVKKQTVNLGCDKNVSAVSVFSPATSNLFEMVNHLTTDHEARCYSQQTCGVCNLPSFGIRMFECVHDGCDTAVCMPCARVMFATPEDVLARTYSKTDKAFAPTYQFMCSKHGFPAPKEAALGAEPCCRCAKGVSAERLIRCELCNLAAHDTCFGLLRGDGAAVRLRCDKCPQFGDVFRPAPGTYVPPPPVPVREMAEGRRRRTKARKSTTFADAEEDEEDEDEDEDEDEEDEEEEDEGEGAMAVLGAKIDRLTTPLDAGLAAALQASLVGVLPDARAQAEAEAQRAKEEAQRVQEQLLRLAMALQAGARDAMKVEGYSYRAVLTTSGWPANCLGMIAHDCIARFKNAAASIAASQLVLGGVRIADLDDTVPCALAVLNAIEGNPKALVPERTGAGAGASAQAPPAPMEDDTDDAGGAMRLIVKTIKDQRPRSLRTLAFLSTVAALMVPEEDVPKEGVIEDIVVAANAFNVVEKLASTVMMASMGSIVVSNFVSVFKSAITDKDQHVLFAKQAIKLAMESFESYDAKLKFAQEVLNESGIEVE